jgi:hypothetical protein
MYLIQKFRTLKIETRLGGVWYAFDMDVLYSGNENEVKLTWMDPKIISNETSLG